MDNKNNHNHHDSIILCWECRTECMKTLFSHCLEMGGNHVEPKHVKLMTDCIQICQTAADFMTRGSKVHESACSACADVCEACAISCEAIGGKEMLHCAEICRKCAASCRKVCEVKKAA